jgi:uncharacterized protein (TIGR00725 family)
MASAPRLHIVGVIGSGAEGCEERAGPLGRWLAQQGVHLLTGGGRGVMEAVSRAFFEVPDRKGLVLGIIPCAAEDRPTDCRAGYPNNWVEVPIRTHLPLSGVRGENPRSRNHIVVLTSAVIVALPGGEGTASEVRLALKYGAPVIAFLKSRDEIPGVPDGVRVADLEGVKEFLSQALARRSGG